jgi:flagellar hook-length control protein FliK
MEIKAETTVSGVAATILTESTSVKNYLEHNLHILQQSFLDQGLKIDRIQVAVQEGFWPHHSSSGNQESHAGTGQQEEADPTVWPSERVERTVEELALDAHTLALMSPHRTFHTVA